MKIRIRHGMEWMGKMNKGWQCYMKRVTTVTVTNYVNDVMADIVYSDSE